MSDDREFRLRLERIDGYEFETTFDMEGVKLLILDEPKPLGKARGPNAARLLGAAVGNCLSASLLFCLEKFRVGVKSISTEVIGTIKRLEGGRMRVAKLEVDISIDTEGDEPKRIGKCLSKFEDYCVVTGSIRDGIDVQVSVKDKKSNQLLYDSDLTDELS
ncbi:OsmC family protein [Patescibacteria group bacterium]|nr:OsmC family protein [Patescibacteria group bacterium]